MSSIYYRSLRRGIDCGGAAFTEMGDLYAASDPWYYASYAVAPDIYAEGIFSAMDRYFGGEAVLDNVYIDFPVVTLENASQYLGNYM